MNIVIMLHWKIIKLSLTITTTLIQIQIIELKLIIITRLAITTSKTCGYMYTSSETRTVSKERHIYDTKEI